MPAPPPSVAEALRRSHTATALVQVVEAGEIIATVPVLSGTVSVDRSAAIRRGCHLIVSAWEPRFVPTGDTAGAPGTYGGIGPTYGADLPTTYGGLFYGGRSPLAPAQGFEVRVYRGVGVGEGSYGAIGPTYGSEGEQAYGDLFGSVMVPLGVFGVSRAVVTDGPEGPVVEIEGWDRSRRIARARWTKLYTVPAGTNYGEAIQAAIVDRLPSAVTDVMGTTRSTPLLVFGETRDNNPWDDIRRMARAVGADVYFDANGVAVMRPEPDASVDPVAWSFIEGDGCTMTDLTRTLDDEKTYNGVIVTGEHPDNAEPVRADAWDDDPRSPTYRYGGYGEVPYFYTSSFITTVEQARDVARSMLRRVRGVEEEVEVTAVPNPFLDAGDVVEVVRARTKTVGRFVVERIDMPLAATEPMVVVARRQRGFVEESSEEEPQP